MLKLIYKNFIPESKILDLGFGQGSEVLFLAQNNFIVEAIDKSDAMVQQLNNKVVNLNLANVKLDQIDIRDYEIAANKFEVIICKDVLNFISRTEALKIIDDIKSKIKNGGYILIEVFTIEDPSFKKESKFLFYFELQELLKLFSDFKIYYYFENMILDPGHLGFVTAHQHGVARLIARK